MDTTNNTEPIFCATCGAANQADALICYSCGQSPDISTPSPDQFPQIGPLPTGYLLKERYQIISQVGTGGFGAVYKAKDTHDNEKVVAIKEINLYGLKPYEIIDATDTFNREVSLLSGLNHANLPTIYEHFTDAEHWYIVMEFIEGETLEEYCSPEGEEGDMPRGCSSKRRSTLASSFAQCWSTCTVASRRLSFAISNRPTSCARRVEYSP